MKHGIKLRKLQRTPSHRWALLRNLVSALLHHESIKTTLPKAKEAARMAEKIITLGKKGTDPARRSAMAFLMPSHSYNPAATHNGPIPPPRPTGYPSTSSDPNADPEAFVPPTTLLPKLFSTLSERYASRPGGYTRIHKFGKRPGDNAPHAILELVDGPRDLKFEMTARAVGREAAQYAEAQGGVDAVVQAQAEDGEWAGLRERTRLGMGKVLKYRGEQGKRELEERAKEWTDRLLAEERASGGLRRQKAELDTLSRADVARTPEPYEGRRYKSGERMSGMAVAHTGLGLARADLGRTFRNGAPDKRPRFINQRPPASSETTFSIDA